MYVFVCGMNDLMHVNFFEEFLAYNKISTNKKLLLIVILY